MDILTESCEYFVLTIVAPRESGKSYLTRHLLQSGLKDMYDNIYVFCPSLRFNHDYDDFLNYENFHFISDVRQNTIEQLIYEHSTLKESLKNNQVFDCPDTLVIFDDCIDSGIFVFKGCVDKIAERGRHINISIIIMSQRLSAVSRSIRINSNFFILFSPFSISELEQFVEQFIPRQLRRNIITALENVYSEPYNFLLLDNTEQSWNLKLKVSNTQDFINNIWHFLDINSNTIQN